ncbi:NADPH:quinone oxidoreductase family protein [Govanella unica]|uniref:NADPH:quinone oxidoreductase family protein n=1 Tax=Govanella unica TaxID=2975056 RepID=A0A9X3U158_9PROT|nr:NADPH:quinone oxidoreductase family protein [Govania unica]
MKAILCQSFSEPEALVYAEVPSPVLGVGQVRIGVHASGVNFPDTLIIRGKYQFKPPFPFSPGGEAAGVVLEVGAGVTAVNVGDRVAATAISGGYAEEMLVSQAEVTKLPGNMSFVQAAGLLVTYGTSYHALVDRANIQPGETLLVLGAAGGVGLAAVQIGKALGARVIAVASTDDKLALARENGADEAINYSTEDLKERVRALTNGQGADVIYDAVGGKATDAVMSAINWKGRLLVVGFASGDIPSVALNRVLLKGCDILGVFWGAHVAREPEKSAANTAALMRLFEDGKITPIVSSTYPLRDAAKAMRDIENRKAKGKIVLVTDREQA